MENKSNETVEIPRAWIERLIELGKNTYSETGDINKMPTKLSQLFGYIESSNILLK